MGALFDSLGFDQDRSVSGPAYQPGPYNTPMPDFGQNGQSNPNLDPDYAPGYQLPQPQPGQQPQQDNQQYFQQMRQHLDSLSEAFKQIEKMQMPGVQGQGGIGGGLMGSGGK